MAAASSASLCHVLLGTAMLLALQPLALSSPLSDTSAESNRLLYFLIQNDYDRLAQSIMAEDFVKEVLAPELAMGHRVTLLAPSDPAWGFLHSSSYRGACKGALASALRHHTLQGHHLAQALENHTIGTEYTALSGLVWSKAMTRPLELDAHDQGNTAGALVRVVRPNAYVSRAVVVHGVDTLLDVSCSKLGALEQGLHRLIHRAAQGLASVLGDQKHEATTSSL